MAEEGPTWKIPLMLLQEEFLPRTCGHLGGPWLKVGALSGMQRGPWASSPAGAPVKKDQAGGEGRGKAFWLLV